MEMKTSTRSENIFLSEKGLSKTRLWLSRMAFCLMKAEISNKHIMLTKGGLQVLPETHIWFVQMRENIWSSPTSTFNVSRFFSHRFASLRMPHKLFINVWPEKTSSTHTAPSGVVFRWNINTRPKARWVHFWGAGDEHVADEENASDIYKLVSTVIKLRSCSRWACNRRGEFCKLKFISKHFNFCFFGRIRRWRLLCRLR